MSRIQAFEKMLAGGKDGHLLRYGLGSEYLEADQPDAAIVHLDACIRLAPTYSAAWKLLGKAYQANGQLEQAASAWESGIQVAQENGDKQAEKEMTIFLKRLRKNT